MSDFQRMNIPEKRSSLADMARAAARRSSQPPSSEVASGLLNIQGGGIPKAPAPPPTARPSAVPAGQAKSDDSGLIDLKALRPPAPALPKPNMVNALDTLNPASVSVAPPSPFDVSMNQALANAVVQPSMAEARGQGRRIMPIAIAMLLATTAGIGGTYFLTRGAAPQPTAAVQAPTTATQTAQLAPPPQEKAATPTPPPAETPAAAEVPAQPEQALAAQAGAGAKAGAAAPARGVAAGPHSRVSRGSAAAAPAPAHDTKTSDKLAAELAKAPEPPAPKAAEAPKAVGGDPLAGAIQKAAGPIDNKKSEAIVVDRGPVSQNSDIPEQPGKGAISGALSGPRGVAKTCLDGHTAPASVSVIFGSDGKVQTVNVSGAGTAADCVKKAFARANVGQFRRATFPVSVTITPP